MKPMNDRPAHAKHRGRPQRRGLTLFELLLALAIFLASVAALAQLLSSGSRAAAQARLQTEAIIRCESKMNELVSGVAPLDDGTGGTFDDDPRWSWQSTVSDGPWPNLQIVEVRVSHQGQRSAGNSTFSLRRYIRDPRLFVTSEAVAGAHVLGRVHRGGRRPSLANPAGSAAVASASEDTDG